MWCPYCGYEMRRGHVRLRGQWAGWAGVLAVNFEVDDGSGEGSEVLPRTLFRSHPRAAHCCVRCEAVLVEPKEAEYVPPPPEAASDTGSSEPAPTTTAATASAPSADGVPAGGAATESAGEAEAEVTTPDAAPTGNGHSAPD